ncbi:MAG TPA: hypothetical protein VE466_14935 [Acidimicrobiales bacterium]|nr:hypothetical protein [Acidimicrobiales bacterium]
MAISVMVVQPSVTLLVDAIERDLRSGNLARVRYWEDRYRRFVQELWRHGVSHLDFSILNVGVTNAPGGERLVTFDPHMVGIAQAYVPDRDGILRDLLAGAIGDCAQLSHRDAPPATTSDTAAWEAACQLIGTAVGKASAR